ncbi:MAG: LLM class flavin-dependent oxidoreductase [Alphaproteobacteria bacterium]|nr:LLM class flavin-dependent oxidoreductase [Alphaproteobacteria bacterium]MBV9693190.1 LLM class flavin-dependent oxidoreductase [Alphaproteobacteria bacterium]
MRLSVLDQSPIRQGGSAADAVAETVALAKACDALGYHRYWLAEHHNSNSFAGSCPEILIGKVASETRAIRVGSGGVMLSHYSPLKVAEQFRMLEVLNPGRIDLGLGRAPGSDAMTARALQAGPQGWGIDAFPSQIHLLRQFLDDAAGRRPLPEDHPYRGIHAMPRAPSAGPQLWLLGSGVHSAVYAAEFGLPFSHAYFISPENSEEAVAAYRERFKPSEQCPQPLVSMGVAALAAQSEEEAHDLAASRNLWVVRLLTNRPIPFPSPDEARDYPFTEQERALLRSVERRSVVGTADQVRAQLLALASAHGADELVIVTITYDYASRLRSYELLAKAFGLPSRL